MQNLNALWGCQWVDCYSDRQMDTQRDRQQDTGRDKQADMLKTWSLRKKYINIIVVQYNIFQTTYFIALISLSHLNTFTGC